MQHCDVCQRYKLNNSQHGELPPREVEVAPWQEVAIDLIGPCWKVQLHRTRANFNALMSIHTVTNWVELIRINN